MHKPFCILTVVLAVICAALVFSGCHDSKGNPNVAAASVPSARVAAAQRGNISRVLTLAGQFQPYQVVDVHPKVSGYMARINVDIGDVVHQGQTLAVLQVPELKAQLRSATFAMEQSKEEITRAQHEIDRAQATYSALHAQSERLKQAAAARPGLIAQQELDNAQAQDLSAQAQVDSARAALAAAQQHMGAATADQQSVEALENYTNVTAPIAGVVIWRYADTGALIQGGTNSNDQALPIVRLSQSSLLRLRVPVPENNVEYVHAGDQLEVRVDAISRSFTGKIVRFTRNVNFETRTMETEIDVDNKDLSIAPGMYANTLLKLEDRRNVITIPVEALVLNGNQQKVYVLDDNNRIHIRSVLVGLEGQKLAEIVSGLSPGDRVVLGGQENYREGQQVDPLLTSEPASDTAHETGGTIDMKAEENEGGNN
ncbi:MAG: efflux RND transporter periplasmic adaptor subunit [Terracidiphilus sp.]|jgi:RND family efflux transporter MFP subunit